MSTHASSSRSSLAPRPALLDAAGLRRALVEAVRKLSPMHLVRSPVMAVVMAGTIVAAIVTLTGNAPLGFGLAVTAILLVTVLFGNFAEAVAEA
ncbi:MAG TPA: potassium-transporting ATPase subunit B, partial [Stenotrophomonas sp.]|nr:potassium-transporting ATPase subunit B [Stenotrophomonas sp.]